MTTLDVTCVHCKEAYQIVAPVVNVMQWQNGDEYIGDALPMLTDDERELLISRTCGKCWSRFYD